MANLNEVAELACRSIFPNPTSAQLVVFQRTALYEYSAAVWIYSKEMELIEGFFNLPSELLTEKEMEVKNNEIDLSELNYLNALSNDHWLMDVGGLNCDCRYVKSTLNQEKKLCDDDSIGDAKTYYVVGKKIKFPKGTHKNKIWITYANTGDGLDAAHVEVNDYIASKVREKLHQLYGNRYPEDKTINNSTNN